MSESIRKTAEAILAFQDDWHEPVWGNVNIPELKALAQAYLDRLNSLTIAVNVGERRELKAYETIQLQWNGENWEVTD